MRWTIDDGELPAIDVYLDEATELSGRRTRTVIVRQGEARLQVDAGSAPELASAIEQAVWHTQRKEGIG